MKAVINFLPEALLEERRRKGLNLYDEMWKGVVHMNPAPGDAHQALLGELFAFLLRLCKQRNLGRPRLSMNVAPRGGWPNDYRIPDLVFVAPARSDRIKPTHIEGAPDLVVEVLSEGDETYEKLDFYFALGTREVWVLAPSSARPELYAATEGGYEQVVAGKEGWVTSAILPVALRRVEREGGAVLEIRAQGEDAIIELT